MFTTIPLTDEEQVQKGEDLVKLIEMDVRDRVGQLHKIRFVRRAYFGPSDSNAYDWDNAAANIELRVVTEKIEGAVPKVSSAFWNADPIVNVHNVSRNVDEEAVDNNQAYVNYLFDQGIEDIYATTQMWFRNTHLDGTSCLKVYYDYTTRPTVVAERMKSWWVAGDMDLTQTQVPQDRQKLPVEILMEYFGPFVGPGPISRGIISIDESDSPAADEIDLDGASYRVTFIEDSRVYEDVLVRFAASDRTDEVILKVHRHIPVHDGVRVEIVEFEDLIVPFRTSNLQRAPRVTHQYWLTMKEIEAKVASGEFNLTEEELENMRARLTGERQEELTDNEVLKDQKDVVSATDGKWNSSEARLEEYSDNKLLFFEVYCRDDVTGEGASEVIYQIPYCTRRIVSAEFLEEKFPHGRRPFPDLHYMRVSDRWASISMGEILAPIQIEVNTIVNMVNDAQELLNNPFFFYVPSAFSADPESLGDLEPGQGVPIGDPNGIIFPTFPQQPLANLGAVDSMLLFADRLTISPQASSGSNQTRNAPRTARGTLALLSEGSVKTDMFVDDAGRGGFPELAHQIHALEAEFGPDEKFYYVTGESKRKKITQKELRGRFMYKFHGNSVNTNREVMRTIAQTRFATLSPDPLYQMDLVARQHLIDDFLRHFSEGADIEKLKPRQPGQGDRLPLPPDTAVRMMMQGVPIQAHPMEDHAAYVSHIDRLMQGKEFEMMPEFAVALIAANYQQHAQLQQQQMAQQGGQPQQSGLSNNVPTQMGDMEGGVA
jgi:hypothetical protein